jgi:hypothetical protein
VWVKNADTLAAWGRGHQTDLSGEGTRFLGWKGAIHAWGDDMAVSLRGGLIEFTATRTDKVFLKGHGRYDLNHHLDFRSPAGGTLILGQSRKWFRLPPHQGLTACANRCRRGIP